MNTQEDTQAAARLYRLSFVSSVHTSEVDQEGELDDRHVSLVSNPMDAQTGIKTTTPGIDTGEKTPKKDELRASDYEIDNGGALREGEAPNLCSKQHIGLLVQYAAIGVLYGSLPRTVYPFLNNYLHMNGYQTLSARVLLSLPWSCKVLVGILSDCFPVWHSRRRAYMVIGWLVCCTMLLVLVFVHQVPPFYMDRTLRSKDLTSISRNDLVGRINWQAPDSGALYIVMMMLASCGYLIADVASDGIVVELAQREPEHIRGNIQSTIYLVRSIAMILAALLVGFGLNGVDYGGSFDWSFNMAQLMLICVLVSLSAIPAAVWFIAEPPVKQRPSFRKYMLQLWELVKNTAMLQVMAYRFFSGIFDGFTITAGDPIQRYWAHVRPLNESLFSVLGLCVFSTALYMTKKIGLQWDWRVVIASTVLSVIAIDAILGFLTIWNVVRSQWFWLGTPILEELPAAMNFLVSTFIVVEMAELGNEAAVYGLLTTIANLSMPFASCISKNVNALFDVSVDDIVSDTTHVRWQVTWTFLIAYAMKILSLGWLVLLPRQKRETQILKRKARHSVSGGVVAVVIGMFALIWSTAANLLSIFPPTACLRLAGGSGCSK
ncbi:Transmembrane protein, partial [Globisporangium splendens]